MDRPIDLVEYLYREQFITLSSIGNIFTFSLVNSFKSNILDKLMDFVLPPASFDYMKIRLPDITDIPENEGTLIQTQNDINLGVFIREVIIWIFAIMILYLLAAVFRFPDRGGFTFNSQQQ